MTSLHEFKKEYLPSPMFCGYCTYFIWGVTEYQQDAYVCGQCGMAVHGVCKKDVNVPCLCENVYEAKQTQFMDAKQELVAVKEELKRAYGYLKDTETRLKDVQITRNQEKAKHDQSVFQSRKELNDMSKQTLKVLENNEALADQARELRNTIRVMNYDIRQLRDVIAATQPSHPILTSEPSSAIHLANLTKKLNLGREEDEEDSGEGSEEGSETNEKDLEKA